MGPYAVVEQERTASHLNSFTWLVNNGWLEYCILARPQRTAPISKLERTSLTRYVLWKCITYCFSIVAPLELCYREAIKLWTPTQFCKSQKFSQSSPDLFLFSCQLALKWVSVCLERTKQVCLQSAFKVQLPLLYKLSFETRIFIQFWCSSFFYSRVWLISYWKEFNLHTPAPNTWWVELPLARLSNNNSVQIVFLLLNGSFYSLVNTWNTFSLLFSSFYARARLWVWRRLMESNFLAWERRRGRKNFFHRTDDVVCV